MYLYERLAKEVDAWRAAGYPSAEYPVLSELLEWARESAPEQPRFLRRAQVRALETHWYLRVVKGTPHIAALYREMFPGTAELLAALGLDSAPIKDYVLDNGVDALLETVRRDDRFVKAHSLESLRESLTLPYPSYILALAMGSGKTVLIGAIVASEFALAMEYPEAPFIQNALVFAPGNTIIESLRELSGVPYEYILPPRLFRAFATSVKIIFARPGDKDIPVVRGSVFNVVVTNTEKIRIQSEVMSPMPLFAGSVGRAAEERREVANLRLQAIASLPHLGVFSDEAHHTYGQNLDTELKKVRKTVDYLAASTNVACVINTTGTPYFRRQPLRDVVVWYGLSEGIRDGVLKELAGSIHAFDFEERVDAYLAHVVSDFIHSYGGVELANGAKAKLALYFPQTDDLKSARPVIDEILVRAGLSPTVCLVNTSDEALTSPADIDAFNRLNHPESQHRIILLVNKGTEGWNCPSLFACGLVRRLKTSNNFVLQAATRCLRQYPGNTLPARVYLSHDNVAVLDKQLQETYGDSLADLDRRDSDTQRAQVVLRKTNIPPIVLTQAFRSVRRKSVTNQVLEMRRPEPDPVRRGITAVTYSPAAASNGGSLKQDSTTEITAEPEIHDVYSIAEHLASVYRVDSLFVLERLRALYPSGYVPAEEVDGLAAQIEEQVSEYELTEEHHDVDLAIVKRDGFRVEQVSEGVASYVADISYPKARGHLVLAFADVAEKAGRFGFHYTPYNFDSQPERSFFEQVLVELRVNPASVEDIFFVGAFTDPSKSDIFVDYRDSAGKWRRYTPDFLIRTRPDGSSSFGRVLIVEIKAERDRDDPVDGINGRKALAMREWERLNPGRVQYHMIFVRGSVVGADQLASVRDFIGGTVS